MKDIRVTKKTNHKTEQIELIISILCLVNGIHLAKTEITVLTYFVVHGIKKTTDDLLINSSIVSPGVLGNIKSKLLKLGFLKRTKELYKTYELNLDKDFNINDNILNVLIKIDNS